MRLSLKLAWLLARRSMCKRAGLRWFTWNFFKTELFTAEIKSEPNPERIRWLNQPTPFPGLRFLTSRPERFQHVPQELGPKYYEDPRFEEWHKKHAC